MNMVSSLEVIGTEICQKLELASSLLNTLVAPSCVYMYQLYRGVDFLKYTPIKWFQVDTNGDR